MSQRIIIPETVTAMIPLLSRIGDDLARAYFEVALLELTDVEPGQVDELARALDRVQAYVNEFERLGATVRSYSPLCVDFIAEVEGEIGYLCWEHGAQEPGRFQSTEALCDPAASAA